MEPISWKKESFWKEPHQKKIIHWNEVELKIKTLGCIFLESDKISKKQLFLQKIAIFGEKKLESGDLNLRPGLQPK